MIKIVGICGSPVKHGNTEAVLTAALTHLESLGDIGTELITLADKQFSGCTHCNWCVKKQSPGRFCQQQDDMDPLYEKLVEADGILLATPVHFGRLSGLLANMVDRLRAFVHGNLYGGRLRNKVGGALAVAFFRGGGIETTLQSLNAVFFIFEMILATSRLYQLGAGALSSEEGKGGLRKGVRHMALEDKYGEASAIRLAERTAELARIVKAGTEAVKP